MKRLLSISAMSLILLTAACGGGNSTADSVSEYDDSLAVADTLAAAALTDSLAAQDSLSTVDSIRVANAIEKGNLSELLEIYDKQCVAVYNEFGSDGMPLGEQPQVLQQALMLRAKLAPMENRMSTQQKALYDSVSGYIRRFL